MLEGATMGASLGERCSPPYDSAAKFKAQQKVKL
jgi:hypothetical protein